MHKYAIPSTSPPARLYGGLEFLEHFRPHAWWPKLLAAWHKSHPVRHLHLRETLPLGEKRALMVVEFEGQRFLLGSTPNSLNLLSELPARSPAEDPDTHSLEVSPCPR